MVFSAGLLGAWYGAQAAQSLALSSGARTASAQTSSAQGQSRSSDVLPPWDPRGEITALETLRRSALATGQFFDSSLTNFSSLDVSQDEKQLFALHQGLRRLQSLSAAASEKTASDTDRAFWARRFDEGLAQLDTFFEDMSLEGVTVLKGEELSKAESTLAISRGRSEYLGGVVHTGAFDAEVDNFLGAAAFTITVRKNGVDTGIAIDLANMGATPRTLDNVTAHINTQLESAGMISRIERARIGEPDENGVIQGENWGLKINGILTEQLSFAATGGAPAVWTAGLSGTGDTVSGQLVKYVDLASGGSAEFAQRLEADPTVTSSTNADGETTTSSTANPFEVRATARSADGAIYVLGETTATIDGQAIKGERDLVLMRYDSTGKRVWTRTLGAAGEASGASLAVDSTGDVVLAGSVSGAFGGTTQIGGTDSLVAKFSADGVEQWARRYGATAGDRINAVTVGADGTIYVAGETNSALGGVPSQGGTDGYIRAFAEDGATLYTRAAEAGAGTERAKSAAMAADGGLIVASEVDGRAVLTKYAAGDDGTGAPAWTLDLGDLDGGRIGGVAVDASGAIYLSGAAGAGFAPGSIIDANQGGRDAVLVRISENGAGTAVAVDYATFLGGAEDNSASSISVADGKVYIAGKTSGALPGATQLGDRNAFAAGFDGATGAREWVQQVSGRGGISEASSIVVDPAGDSVLDRFGLPSGEVRYADSRVITARSSVREGDHFYISVDGGRKRKITIDADETMRSLTFKLNAVLVLDGTADVRRSANGDMLRVKPKEGVTVTFSRGSEGQDALSGLGLVEGAVTGKASLLDKTDETDAAAPSIFALELPARLRIGDLDSALAASEALTKAQSMIQRAWRDLTMDPALKNLLSGPQAGRRGGTVPAYLQAQIANYSAGLDRLYASGGGGSTLALF
ncbi:MAG: hypothetical protein NXI12_14735 [Alphaproteobacteria bacterium]|nr:hypothetical protein [Alphaproteobacteria bacterium]